MRFAAILPLWPFLFLLPGCLHEPDADFLPDTPDPPAVPVARADVTTVWQAAPAEVPPAPPSPLDRVRPDPVPFRLGAGHGALGQVDLAPCREDGLQTGYLRMRVTFRRDGRVVHAAVESPVAPPQEALDCISDQLEDALVPSFDGRDATLSRSFFVEPEAGEAQPDPGEYEVRRATPRRRRHAAGGGAHLTVLDSR